MRNIYTLPTNLASELFLNKEGILLESYILRRSNARHIYITSDGDIKEGDWCLLDNNVGASTGYDVCKCDSSDIKNGWYGFGLFYTGRCKKIVITTNQDLIKDGVEEIDDKFLQWFLKNQTCEEVYVEVTTLWLNKKFGGTWQPFPDETATQSKKTYKIIIPKEENLEQLIMSREQEIVILIEYLKNEVVETASRYSNLLSDTIVTNGKLIESYKLELDKLKNK